MYASIRFNAGVTVDQIIDDIVKILTGETSLAALSASVDQVNSELYFNLSPAGWEIHDDLRPGTKSVILKAPMTDMPGQFKYIRLRHRTFSTSVAWTSNNAVCVDVIESWDEIAHTGNLYNRFDSGGSSLNTQSDGSYASIIFGTVSGQSGNVMISSSSKHLFFHHQPSMNSPNISGTSYITEHTRESPWDTVTNNYKNIIYSNRPIGGAHLSNQYSDIFYAVGIKPVFPASVSTNYEFSNGSSNSAKVMVKSFIGSGVDYTLVLSPEIVDELKTKNNQSLIYGFGVHNIQYGNIGGDISTISKVFLGFNFFENNNSRVLIDGQYYRVWQMIFALTHIQPTLAPGSYPILVVAEG